MIIILGRDDDEHAIHVLQHVRQRGFEAELLDSRWFPEFVQLSAEVGPEGTRGTLSFPSGRSIQWTDIYSIYWRTYEGVQPPDQSAERSEVAYHDSRSMWESFLQLCPTRWVNGLEGYELHKCKPMALARVAALALPTSLKIPRTLVGNDPERAREFTSLRVHKGSLAN